MPSGGRREGSGRKAGVPNKITSDLRSMILGALDKVGGIEYLVRQAEDSPTAFLALVGKILPTQLTGHGDGPVTYQIVTGVPRDED